MTTHPGAEALANMRAVCTGREAANEIRMDRTTGLAMLAYVAKLEADNERLRNGADLTKCTAQSIEDKPT